MEKHYMINAQERADLKDRLERAIVCNINERDVLRAVEIAIEGVYCAKAHCWLGDNTCEAVDIILQSHINGESTMDEISEVADEIVAIVGKTNEPEFWVED